MYNFVYMELPPSRNRWATEPTTLLQAQELAVKIDRNMQSSGEFNLPGYSRSSTPLKEEDPYKNK